MKEYKYKINGNLYNVVIGDIEENIAHVEVNGTHYTVEMEKKPKAAPAPKPVVRPVAKPAAAAAPAALSGYRFPPASAGHRTCRSAGVPAGNGHSSGTSVARWRCGK